MTEPLRWRDDTAFLRSTGIDVAAEAGTLPTPDIASLRARVLQAIATGALPTAAVGLFSLKALVLAAAGSAVIGAVVGGVVGGVVVNATHSAPSPTLPAPPAAAVGAVSDAEVDAVSDAVVDAVSDAVVDAGVVKPVEAVPPVAPPRPLAPAPASSATHKLAEELNLYQRAQAALDRKNAAAAVADFEEVLRRFPQGMLRKEAALGLTQALLQTQQYEKALHHLDRLLHDGGSPARRAELFRLRAGALLALHRCEEARIALHEAGADDDDAAGCVPQ